MTEQKKTREQMLEEIEWLLEEESLKASEADEEYSGQNYGDLVQLNTKRTIADSVGPEILHEIAGDYLDLLGSGKRLCTAIFAALLAVQSRRGRRPAPTGVETRTKQQKINRS